MPRVLKNIFIYNWLLPLHVAVAEQLLRINLVVAEF